MENLKWFLVSWTVIEWHFFFLAITKNWEQQNDQGLFSHYFMNIWHPLTHTSTHTHRPFTAVSQGKSVTVTRQMRQIIPPHTHYLNHVRPGHPKAKAPDWPLVCHASHEEELVLGNVAVLIKGAICETIAYFVIATERWMSQRLWHHRVPRAPAN